MTRHLHRLGDGPSLYECPSCGDLLPEAAFPLRTTDGSIACFACQDDPSSAEPDQWNDLQDEMGCAGGAD